MVEKWHFGFYIKTKRLRFRFLNFQSESGFYFFSALNYRLSFAAPVGLLLSCNHIYNQYVFIDNSDETLQKFEKTARNMHSLSRYSRQNAINKEWIDEYLNEAHSQGLQSVRAHFNVLAWGEDMEELKHLRNDVGSQLASMECVPRHNTVNCPTLFWAAIPGNEGDFP